MCERAGGQTDKDVKGRCGANPPRGASHAPLRAESHAPGGGALLPRGGGAGPPWLVARRRHLRAGPCGAERGGAGADADAERGAAAGAARM